MQVRTTARALAIDCLQEPGQNVQGGCFNHLILLFKGYTSPGEASKEVISLTHLFDWAVVFCFS